MAWLLMVMPLQLHVVEHLILHVALADGVGHLQQTVGQRALAVVNMGYYAKIAYVLHQYLFHYYNCSSAACTLWATARLVYVAPLTVSTVFLRACFTVNPFQLL